MMNTTKQKYMVAYDDDGMSIYKVPGGIWTYDDLEELDYAPNLNGEEAALFMAREWAEKDAHIEFYGEDFNVTWYRVF